VTSEDLVGRLVRRNEQDRPASESVADGLARTADQLEAARATRSELLAAEAEAARADQEHRTAVSVALRNVVTGGAEVPRSVVEGLMARKAKRTDGTTVSLEDRTPDRNVASDTGWAEGLDGDRANFTIT
jgi:hypothetical protein